MSIYHIYIYIYIIPISNLNCTPQSHPIPTYVGREFGLRIFGERHIGGPGEMPHFFHGTLAWGAWFPTGETRNFNQKNWIQPGKDQDLRHIGIQM